jgi:carboxylesterase type B
MHSFLPSLFLVSGLALVRAAPNASLPAGKVFGTTCPDGASAFLSIPFAKSPVGDLRWAAPQAYNETFPASGLNATTAAPLCIQFGGVEFTEQGTSSEDWYLPPPSCRAIEVNEQS